MSTSWSWLFRIIILSKWTNRATLFRKTYKKRYSSFFMFLNSNFVLYRIIVSLTVISPFNVVENLLSLERAEKFYNNFIFARFSPSRDFFGVLQQSSCCVDNIVELIHRSFGSLLAQFGLLYWKNSTTVWLFSFFSSTYYRLHFVIFFASFVVIVLSYLLLFILICRSLKSWQLSVVLNGIPSPTTCPTHLVAFIIIINSVSFLK